MLLALNFFVTLRGIKGAPDDMLFLHDTPRDLLEDIWHSHFKEPTDTVGGSYFDALKRVREHFMECRWYEVYD
jgi:hypothetical protein